MAPRKWWMLLLLLLLLLVMEPPLLTFRGVDAVSCGDRAVKVPEEAKDGVCSDMQIRNGVKNLEALTNCSVIQGSLHISLMDNVAPEEFEKYSFPELREITGHLMLYRVYGLRSLKHLFPNLAVIRGQNLFFNSYALVAFEMRDLEELGLVRLTAILKGAVHLSKNHKLCYVTAIDWERLAVGVEPREHQFKENREDQLCPNYCREECPSTKYNGISSRRCWTSEPGDCQKNLACNCAGGQPCGEDGTCCHPYCLGGCSGPSASDCFACKNVLFQGECHPVCPHGTYKLSDHSCLTDKQCLSLSPVSGSGGEESKSGPKLLEGSQGQPSLCVFDCPVGYKVDESKDQKIPRCVLCGGFCPKVCNSTIVHSIEDSKRLFGCSKVSGNLDIQIMSGENIDKELTKNMGGIREVTGYIKIMRSYALLTLHFFKGLEIIGGEQLALNLYSLLVVDNSNLLEIFPQEQMNKMAIRKGRVSFHGNRKLCFGKISNFTAKVGVRPQLDSKGINVDISNTTNGDLIPCLHVPLNVVVTKIAPIMVVLKWERYHGGDARQLINYIIHYKKVTEPVVDLYAGRDACSETEWSTQDVQPSPIGNVSSYEYSFLHLEPFTKYAVYIQAYTLPTASVASQSKVIYIKTSPAVPSEPLNLEVKSNGPHELTVKWQPPKKPNGRVTHYKVFYNAQKFNGEGFQKRDFCDNPMRNTREIEAEKEKRRLAQLKTEKEAQEQLPHQCCACPKSKEQVEREKEDRQREISFENELHNAVYTKKWRTECLDKDAEFELPDMELGNRRVRRQAMVYNDGLDFDRPLTSKDVNMNSMYGGYDSSEIFGFKPRPAVVNTGSGGASGGGGNVGGGSGGVTVIAGTTTISTTAGGKYVTSTARFTTAGPEVEKANASVINATVASVVVHEVIIYDTEVQLSDLQHFQNYNIEVIACHETNPDTGEKLCGTGAITTEQTKPDPKSDNINVSSVHIELMSNKTGEVLIKWSPPKQPNGLILKYNVQYQQLDLDRETIPETVCVSTRRYLNASGGHRLPGLAPGNYSLKIMAHSLAGNGSFTPAVFFSIPHVAGPDENNTGTVVAIFLVVATLFAIVIVVAVYRYFRWKKKQAETMVSQNPYYMPTGELYIPDEWEMPRDNIRLIKELGQGSFGTVCEGQMYNPHTKTHISVAIKTVNDKADFHERIKILTEATTMKVFECHHVVKLLGVVSKGQPALVVMELMAQGDLRNYLRKCRVDEEEYLEYHPPTTNQIRQMAGEIADGMAYLADKKIVHRDLAARNCLVAKDLTVKIADFGMARDVYMTDYYRKDQRALLPVRWMAPESLHDGIFTTMSDIWSYGVVLWEMVTLAEQPYQGLSNEEVRRFIMEARVMSAPVGCPLDLYCMMEKCWKYNPKQRPTFKNLIELLVPYLSNQFREVSYFFQEVIRSDAEDEEDMEEEEEEDDDDDDDNCRPEGEEFEDEDYEDEEDDIPEAERDFRLRDEKMLRVAGPDEDGVSGDRSPRYSSHSSEEDEEAESDAPEPYFLSSVSDPQVTGAGGGPARALRSRDGSRGRSQSGERSPLLLHQGDVQEPLLYPPPPSMPSSSGGGVAPQAMEDFDNIDVDDEDSDNNSNYLGPSRDAKFVSERLKLLPGSPAGPSSRTKPNRQAGLVSGNAGGPPPSSSLSPQLSPDYTIMSPKSTLSSSPLVPPSHEKLSPASAASLVTPPPAPLSTFSVPNPTPSSGSRQPPFSPAPPLAGTGPASVSKPVLQVDMEGVAQPRGLTSKLSAFDRPQDSGDLYQNKRLTEKSLGGPAAAPMGAGGDASTSASSGGKKPSSSSSSNSESNSISNSGSEGGSKESSSSSGSGHHRFNGPTANGHGPFSHQQAALC
ncbi:putative molluscan insulin-related peptide(s) receptor [Aplysia californica]|uniref:Tyrosine-protein kinase receptor n=1 Tax=Aplysia californica TaxID=6500 RepID=A0ABM0ZW99_APLCA|nr:putative molluscan insulin-related peptide(s) receptor [Aplysia californica]